MSAVFSPNKNLIEPASGSFNNAWAAPVNSNWAIIDQALAGIFSIDVTGITNPYNVLSIEQYQPLQISFYGVLTQDTFFIIPNGVCGQWVIVNACTGGFNLFFNTNGGLSVNCPTGYRSICVSDGTNMNLADSGTAYTAQANAQAYALSVASAAQTAAETAAQGYASAAQTAAETAAQGYASAAQTNAEIAAQAYASAAQTAAETAAQGYASAAQTASENYAASVASAAQTAAINSAVMTSEAYANGLTTGGSNSNGTYRKTSDGTLEQWGVFPAGQTGNGYTQTFPTNFSSVRSIVLSPIGQDSTYYIATIANNAFSVYIGAYNTQFYWVAYGRT